MQMDSSKIRELVYKIMDKVYKGRQFTEVNKYLFLKIW